MSLRTYTRIELAKNQLKTAVTLFLCGGDRFSAISLAGASDVILSRLVTNMGKENFTEFSLKNEIVNDDSTNTKESYGKHINNILFINHLKHMDKDEDGYIDIDVDECVMAAILKAMANYVILAGRNHDFVQAFLAWVHLNLDPEKYNIYCDPNWKPAISE